MCTKMMNELKNLVTGVALLGTLLGGLFTVGYAAQHHPRIFMAAVFLMVAWLIGAVWRGDRN